MSNNGEHFCEWCLRGKARSRRALLATLRLIAQPPLSSSRRLLGGVQAKGEPLNRPVEVRHRAACGCGGREVRGRQPVPCADAVRHDLRLFMAHCAAYTLAAMKYRERYIGHNVWTGIAGEPVPLRYLS